MSASLQSLSDFLAEGLGLDTTFVPEYADALALVQLGITFLMESLCKPVQIRL